MSTPTAIDVKHVFFSYDTRHVVLRDISFNVPEGATLALLGASGAGKSTLVRLLCGLLRGTKHTFQGSIQIGGQTDTLALRRAGKIGFMFQQPALLPHLSVASNVALPLDMRTPQSSSLNNVSSLLQLVGLEHVATWLPSRLSVGMRTRVALARTFCTKPSFLLLDEPFSALDQGWRFALYDVLNDLRRAHRPTTVMVTHDIQEAILLADTIVVLSSQGILGPEFRLTGPPPVMFTPNSVNERIRQHRDLHVALQEIIYDDHRNWVDHTVPANAT